MRKIVERVRDGGDAELLACVRKYDGAQARQARGDARGVRGGRRDHRSRRSRGARQGGDARARVPPQAHPVELGDARRGRRHFGIRVRPLQRVGIYVPGGKATYPSSVIMNAVPASVVEVPEIVMATPAQPDGSLRPEVLMAAQVAGVHRIFKMGGAHAIAALAYGTESVPRVDKIVGPGNVYVAAAKRFVFGDVAIDGEAGPTEVLIIADSSATPAWVAADLLSQAEHDEMACVIADHAAEGPRRARPGADRAPAQDAASARRSPARRSPRAARSWSPRTSTSASRSPTATRPSTWCWPSTTPTTRLEARPQRRRDLPRALHAGGRRRLSRRSESRAADGRHGALLLAARRRGLPQALERDRASSRRSCASWART